MSAPPKTPRAQADGTVRRDFPADPLADQVSALGDGWLMVQPVERKRFDRRRTLSLIEMAMAMLRPSEPAEPRTTRNDSR